MSDNFDKLMNSKISASTEKKAAPPPPKPKRSKAKRALLWIVIVLCLLVLLVCGTAVWGFFASCLTGNSDTFSTNAALFGKVYFPRLTVPISNVLVALARFGIQMLPVLAMVFYYTAAGVLHPVWRDWLLLPLVLLQLGMLGMGFGILFSSLTTKYRDLSVLIKFGTGLWMYATPVVYPLSELHLGKIMTFVRLNPVTMPVELFRRALFGVGTVEPGCLWLSVGVTAAVALLGVVLFSRVERTFMDTI